MDEQAQSAVPMWFWVAAVLAVLFEAVGCYSYISEVSMSDAEIAGLPIDVSAMLAARTTFYYAAFAIAVWLGLAGSLLLLMRRKLAEPLLLVSLIAVVAQFAIAVLTPAMSQVTPDSAYTVPIVVFVVCYGIYMLARRARKHGWLR